VNAPISPTALINPFALPPNSTLADVFEQVANSSLSPIRKRDCLSAVRRVAKLLGQELSKLTDALARQSILTSQSAAHTVT
jgi:hypothetical protein